LGPFDLPVEAKREKNPFSMYGNALRGLAAVMARSGGWGACLGEQNGEGGIEAEDENRLEKEKKRLVGTR
jgi:hypothetical protein